jgi:hypothetical protein
MERKIFYIAAYHVLGTRAIRNILVSSSVGSFEQQMLLIFWEPVPAVDIG